MLTGYSVQVEVADWVVLNKVDLLGDAKVPELEAIIRSLNPLCETTAVSHGAVRILMLFFFAKGLIYTARSLTTF